MAVNATLGTVENRDGGVIAVPVSFAENVVAEKSIVAITRVSGDDLAGLEYRLVGEDTAFTLIVTVPPDRSGSFSVDLAGSVWKRTDSTWDTVSATAVTVDYSTVVPFLENYDVPASFTPGEIFDVVLQFNVPVTFVDPVDKFGSPAATFLDHFIFEGAALGLPTLYRKLDDTYPALPIANLSEWSNIDLTTEAATLYLIRFNPVNESAAGAFNLTLKEGSVKGPVS